MFKLLRNMSLRKKTPLFPVSDESSFYRQAVFRQFLSAQIKISHPWVQIKAILLHNNSLPVKDRKIVIL